jgi:hypothetical protein
VPSGLSPEFSEKLWSIAEKISEKGGKTNA